MFFFNSKSILPTQANATQTLFPHPNPLPSSSFSQAIMFTFKLFTRIRNILLPSFFSFFNKNLLNKFIIQITREKKLFFPNNICSRCAVEAVKNFKRKKNEFVAPFFFF